MISHPYIRVSLGVARVYFRVDTALELNGKKNVQQRVQPSSLDRHEPPSRLMGKGTYAMQG